MAKRELSKDAQTPVWRTRIAAAVAPHGRLKAIAQAAEMESPQLQKIANGTTKDPGITTLGRIAKAMGITLADLITEPRPGEAGHDASGGPSGGAGLADSLRRALHEYEHSGEPPKDWRGDVLIAIFALTRALQRSPAPADAERQTREAQR